MEYKAINNNIIVERIAEEIKTKSGIILTKEENTQVVAYRVLSTTEETKTLDKKTLFINKNRVTTLEDSIGVVDVKDILATN